MKEIKRYLVCGTRLLVGGQSLSRFALEITMTDPVQMRTFALYALLIGLYHLCENYLTGLYKTYILRHSRKVDGF